MGALHTVIPKCMLGKYVPQDTEASAPRYIRPFCLTESQSEGDGRKWEGGGADEKAEEAKKIKSEKSRVICFFISGCAAGECTHSTSGDVCSAVGGELREGNLDVREMSDKGLACLALLLHILKRELLFLRFALHDLNMSSALFPQNE